MAFRVFNGSTWNTQKALQIYTGSTWTNAVRGWIFNGANWSIAYPEFPLNTSSPSISGSQAFGSTLSVGVGSWDGNAAYAPSSYTYQWLRNGSSISGATSSSYSTVSADVGQNISCIVYATNARGSTPAISNSIQILPVVSSVSVSDITTTPGNPGTPSVTGGTNSWSASWTAGTNATNYGVYASTGSISYSAGSLSASATSATPGTVTVYVYSINTSCVVQASWPVATGATSYDVYRNGSFVANTTNTSYSFSGLSAGVSTTVTVYAKYNSIQGFGASGSGTPSATTSNTVSGSGTVLAPVVAPTYITYTASTSKSYLHTNATLYTQTGESLSLSNVSSDGTSPVTITYNWGYTSSSGGSINTGFGSGSSFTVPSSWNGYEIACVITASNSVGNTSVTTTRWGPVVAPNATPQAPTNVYGLNDNSPTGGSFYYDQAVSVDVAPGIGSSYWNYNSGPVWGFEWERYRSTTSGGTFTLHNSGVRTYTEARKVTTTSTGYFYFRIRTYAANGTTVSSWTRAPASGSIQFT